MAADEHLESGLFSCANICVVLFDLDGTLRHTSPTYVQLLFDLAAQLGVSVSRQGYRDVARWQHYYWAQSAEMQADLGDLNGLSETFWTNYICKELRILGCSLDQATALAPQIAAQFNGDARPKNWAPPDVVETLRGLKEAGFRLGIVSNRATSYRAELEMLGLGNYFELVLAAGEIDAWKPEPGIFLHAVAQFGASPSEAVYVGDNYFADVIGAQRAGLHPVLLDPEGIFPEATCPVIRRIGELKSILLSTTPTAQARRRRLPANKQS